MTKEKRIEVFILIREKMDEIAEIIRNNNAGPEFMCSYCFGMICDTDEDESPESYEFLAGYSADDSDELSVMFNVIAHSFTTNDDDDNDEPTNSIEYWLKK